MTKAVITGGPPPRFSIQRSAAAFDRVGALPLLEPERNLRQLTGLRGVAALAVVCHHAASEGGRNLYLRGQPMVDIFFVLSGFVMGYVYLSRGRMDWRSFALARFARIYPLHAATAITMALAAVAYAWLSHHAWPAYINPVQGLREATLTMAMPVVGADKLWNFPAWSISVEWWVYFTVFPVLAAYGSRLSNRQALAAFVVAALVLSFLLYFDSAKPTRGWLAFARAAVGFGGGWVAYRLATTTRRKMSPLQADLAFALVVLAIYSAIPLFGVEAWYLIPFYPLMVFGLATTECGAARFLSSRPLEWLGEISFSVYLVHPIVMNVLEAVSAKVTPIEGQLTWVLLVVPLSIVASTISYAWFEKPVRRLFRTRRAGGGGALG